MKRTALLLSLLSSIFLAASAARADSFGSGTSSFDVEFVAIGHPGNPPDTTGQPSPAGSVSYAYRIGKYEIPERAIDSANAVGGLGITLDARGPDKPATSIDWFEAARFVNWLNTSRGHTPAYKFIEVPDPRRPDVAPPTLTFALWAPADPGYNPDNLFRNSQAKYFLPSADEWYKAAYYDPDAGAYWNYPTGSNVPPTPVPSGTAAGTAVVMQPTSSGPAQVFLAGGLSPFGTMAQAGNVSEWEETELDLTNNSLLGQRGGRGVAWSAFASSSSATFRFGADPATGLGAIGVRVASVIPEPSTAAMCGTALLAWLGLRWRTAVRAAS
ncbi:MAG: SUMF1/EgtB/PvdO family nonheme iron enzyme [Pirellulales bacterium]|nr:SUMF1/EgtB/PvdO family nonheme iron enzyme [Pirellulales bacterium]